MSTEQRAQLLQLAETIASRYSLLPQVEAVAMLRLHQTSVGYFTCSWNNVLLSQVLYDRSSWFQTLQQTARQPYPEALRHAILAKNYPLLRQNMSSYLHQLEIAVARDDLVSLNLGFITGTATY